MEPKPRKTLLIHRDCTCARCRKVPTANQRWGYDEAAVPATCCFVCLKPIGKAVYLIDTSLARFGQMLFVHEACRAVAP